MDHVELVVFCVCLVSLIISVFLTSASLRAWLEVATHPDATISDRRLTRIHVRTDVGFSAMQMGMASLSAYWWTSIDPAPIFTLLVRGSMALLLAASIAANHYDRHRL